MRATDIRQLNLKMKKDKYVYCKGVLERFQLEHNLDSLSRALELLLADYSSEHLYLTPDLKEKK